jgi:hypothetical protein
MVRDGGMADGRWQSSSHSRGDGPRPKSSPPDTEVLNQAVKRNGDRFPDNFMFQLSDAESESLRLQIVTSNQKEGRRYRPFAFGEPFALRIRKRFHSPAAR